MNADLFQSILNLNWLYLAGMLFVVSVLFVVIRNSRLGDLAKVKTK